MDYTDTELVTCPHCHTTVSVPYLQYYDDGDLILDPPDAIRCQSCHHFFVVETATHDFIPHPITLADVLSGYVPDGDDRWGSRSTYGVEELEQIDGVWDAQKQTLVSVIGDILPEAQRHE